MGTIDAHGALHDNEGRYANQNKPSAGYDLDAQPTQPDVAWDTDPSATNQIKHYLAAETAVGGPESMTAAKTALWRTALWADAPDLYGDEDDEGFHECYLCGAESPAGEIDAHMRNDHPQYTSGLTAADIAPESKAEVEADFEAWAAENADAVKTFTETVGDPDGGDPAEFLAHNWWLTRNGHGTGFKNRLYDDPAYAEAMREQMRRQNELGGAQIALNDAYRAAERANSASSPAEQRYAEAQDRVRAAANDARATPLSILRANAQSSALQNFYDEYPPRDYGEFSDQDTALFEERQSNVRRANRAYRRAEALTALDQATPTSEYDVYIGDDGKVHVG